MERRIGELEDPASEISLWWNQQHDLHVAKQLMAQVEPDFAPQTWTAFKRVTIDGRRADSVAAELGVSLNAVFIAKSRVLRRLRQEAAGLVESDSRLPPAF